MDQNLRTLDWNVTKMDRSLSFWLHYISLDYFWITLADRIEYALYIIQHFYYPILAIVGVPINLATLAILFNGKCGLSNCVTRYLMAMAAADLLVAILDLILRHIPIVYKDRFDFLYFFPVCNIHAVLLYAATDCTVWFTVAFTFDRFVAICCQKLKSKFCSEKVAAVVLGTITVLSCLKNIFWFFMFKRRYILGNIPWFCSVTIKALESPIMVPTEFLYNILTPGVPFVLVLLFNGFTVRHILVASRARRRFQAHSNGEISKDPEMESRRKSIILLFVISVNFIVLWSTFMVYTIWIRMWWLGFRSVLMHSFVRELGFMLQLLSCCTNTAIYVVTQAKFREQLKNMLKLPFAPINLSIKLVN
ncbi:probable G-protein coupled receptor 139 [Stegostoma tigrinum]|uniref:probable G-protein coupled receptor 139 n=1 Tax=Stegostoma tigrinum TaxID=3053191 RepID=UPI00202B8A25|nr:probable G-protein coupled receptor 139 [Stegostoma tigrinum]